MKIPETQEIVEYENGDIEWKIGLGKFHREDGPAIELIGGYKEWWYYGNKAKDKKEFYNSKWRNLIFLKEIK